MGLLYGPAAATMGHLQLSEEEKSPTDGQRVVENVVPGIKQMIKLVHAACQLACKQQMLFQSLLLSLRKIASANPSGNMISVM